ncbi:uncharacterized protein FIBRA_00993 [Fibroporia radiculosa]|uniref:RecA family profile 1 domain-containing protein n=1 Tax=Fibroporia radiculosa TaxID=599839 RepID=J4GJ34_9APHY|nr:uncharacterized protein FIBRA_00993 [Fibroporia radiculosa]CCL98985.1 predicted protein [Fibroporia radiculosa]
MDSPISADSMLAEIQMESLQNLLTAIRHETSPLGTHISTLDESTRAGLMLPNFSRGDVIEVQGPAASGKTHLLYSMLMTCILPSEFMDIKLGGWGKAAVLLDTDDSFDISRFHQLLASRVCNILDTPISPSYVGSSSPAEDLAMQCLQNLHIFRPTSSLQLAATISYLSEYHLTHPALQSREIGFVAVDSLSSFYWNDRFAVEQLRANNGSGARSPNPLHHVLAALQRLRTSHGAVILLTNWGLNPLTPTRAGEPVSPFYRQHLYPFPIPTDSSQSTRHSPILNHAAFLGQRQSVSLDWTMPSADQPLPLTAHITLRPLFIQPFPSDITLRDAKQEEGSRRAILMKSGVQGLVRIPGKTAIGDLSVYITDLDILVSQSGDNSED